VWAAQNLSCFYIFRVYLAAITIVLGGALATSELI
jgi:hypothetical protein